MIALVAAMDAAGLIGVGGRLPWHLPSDLARFRALTMGGVVLWRRDLPTAAGAFLAVVGLAAALWSIGFVGAGFTGATIRGAVMLAVGSFAWWLWFARKGGR